MDINLYTPVALCLSPQLHPSMNSNCFLPARLLVMLTLSFQVVLSIAQFPYVAPEALTSGGNHFKTINLHLDYTFGEFMVKTLDGSSRLTQGFQQPGLESITPVTDPSFNGKIEMYPNPFAEVLYVKVEDTGIFKLILSDIQGRIITHSSFSGQIKIAVDGLASGIYVVHLEQSENRIQSSLFIKK